MTETKEQNHVIIPDFLTVKELADILEASPIEVIKQLMSNGIMASINQQIDFETAAIVAAEMGFEAEPVVEEVEEDDSEEGRAEWRTLYETEDPDKLELRPPVVTILGHVDHGKTSLLDKIRSANVTEGESGGITQHIGAYQIEHDDQAVTFLDTPGHEAFTAMRERGAKGADIAVLVVAADDGVMPQTREAIAHARAAGVPIVVALNKIDRSNANPDFVKQQLAEVDLVPDEWDGDTLVIPVSAMTGEGIDDLLEAILLVASDTSILANPTGKTAGTVIEAELERSRGVMTTLIVQNGTLERGDTVLAGTSYGRIKAMFDENGNTVKQAGPSTPVRIMGLNEAPAPGTLFTVVKSEKVARSLAEEEELARESEANQPQGLSLDELFARFQAGETKELNLIVKADVQGSIEPIVNGLEQITFEEDGSDLKVNILHAEIGNISESDVSLAAASGAIVVGFQVKADSAAKRKATSEGIEIRLYSVIYKLFEDIELALKGMLEPVYEYQPIGVAEVQQVFSIPRIGKVAGSVIRDGVARRDARARVIREDRVIHEGSVSSLKRFQEDVKEVRTGFECGINVDGFTDFKKGDYIQFMKRVRVQ